MNDPNLSSFIWSVAELLRGDCKQSEYGKAAVRVPVKLGRSSVSTIEIVGGVQAGDQMILSDRTSWDANPRVQLK